ncbi:family 78 glycoside hydrolase catalytic domain [Aquirufa sp. A-Brett2-W8]
MKKLILACLLFVLSFVAQAQFSLQNLQVEYQKAPLGIDEAHPRFSWQMNSSVRNAKQTAYHIVVQSESGQIVWDSKKQNTDISVGIQYNGEALQAKTAYRWTLEVWDSAKKKSTQVANFETGLLNPSLEAWKGADWIGSNDLNFYTHYLSVYKFQYGVQIDKGTKASFVFGANDPRLQNRNLNIQDVNSGVNQSYVRLELDLSGLETSDSGQADLHIYRVGYDKKDRADQAFKSFKIPPAIINAANKSQKHTVFADCNFGVFDFYIDAVDKAHKINPTPKNASPYAATGVNLNPIGAGNNFISFPMLSEIGFATATGESARFSDVIIRNFRLPSNPLFEADQHPGLWKELPFDGKVFSVSGKFSVANPSRHAAPMLRTEFAATTGKTIKSARIYATARGIYELYLNGKRVGDEFFNPGLTQYNKTHTYQVFDVTSLLNKGKNAWGAWLSEGWWSGNITYSGDSWNYFGDRQSLLASLEIRYTDGTEQVIQTNPNTWKSFTDGPIRVGSFFQGEVYDARKNADIEGWSATNFNDKNWTPAANIPLEGNSFALDYQGMKLVNHLDDRVTVQQVLQAKSISEPRKGVYVYDMGQNMVGFPKIFIKNGQPGQIITQRFAEVLYPDLAEYAGQKGMIMLENIRAALAQDIHILKGGDEYIQPRFTFHGYRYLEITGIEKAPELPQVAGIVLSSVKNISSYYETSDPMVNKLWLNITWSMRSNFLSIPTDTPARNERMGWSGDINVFSKTATMMAPVNNFMRRHLLGMRDVQRADGRFTDVAPMGGGFGGTLWGSAGIVIPWETYLQYGDKAMLAEHYPAMKRYMTFLDSKVKDGILNEGPLGDWLSPEGNKNDNTLFWMAYQAADLAIVSKVAHVLGFTAEGASFLAQSEAKKISFNEIYVDKNHFKTIKSGVKTDFMGPPNANATPEASDKGQLMDTQASYAIPLALNVFNASNAPKTLENLVETIKRSNKDDQGEARPPFSLMTGFIGTAAISEALSANGKHDIAYGLLTTKTYPSWLYSVANGATSIWERLNSYTIENGFGGNNSMNSFNHYSFGAVAAWMYTHSLGIQRDETSPGYQHFILQPTPDPSSKITSAKGHVETMYGKIASEWIKKGNKTTYHFTIPANTSAQVKLPQGKILKGLPLEKTKTSADRIEFELGAGLYEFVVESN